ncbi:MAG: STAS domain-containing protein [Oscillospiraceae bacterium]|nr:STAS domain-containing protein [Oscillospiraceae bacterium]
MEIKKNEMNESIELILTGRLDTITAPKLQTVLSEALQSFEATELDFAEVAYVSSAGLRVLLQGQKIAQNTDKSLKLKNVSSEVMEVFDVTGFSGILTII